MALTLKDIVESRLYQRASSVRRDLTETREAAQARRERFSLEDAEQKAATQSQIRASANAKADAARSRVGRSDTGSPYAGKTDVARSGTAMSDATRLTATRFDAEDATGAKRDVTEPDRSKPEAAKPYLAKSEKTSTETGSNEPARADSARQKGRGERSEAPATSTSGKSPAASQPSSATGVTADPAQTGASTAEGETAEATTASGEIAGKEASATEIGADVSAAASPTMAVVAAPPMPVAPLLRGASKTDAAEADGESEIDATGSSTNAVSVLGAATGSARGAKLAESGFAEALGEITSDGSGDDATASTKAQGAESAGGSVTSPFSASNEVKATTAAQQQASATTASVSVPLGAVPMTIGLRALGASSRFEIRLDPKDLGRIDVSIDIDKDKGTVGASLVVDRPETLALLQRDAATLQQALAQTGLDTSAGISLSLRSDQGNGQRNGGDSGADAQTRGGNPSDRAGLPAGTETAIDLAPLRTLRGLGRIDIRI